MTASYLSKGKQDNPAIVLMHGVGSGKEGWIHQLEGLAAQGWRAVAVDAPGFGTTPLPPAPGFDPHVDAVTEVMDALDIQRAVLCGHSLGGMTAQEIMAAHPQRVTGLVLSATSPAFGKSDGDFQRKFLRERFEPFEQGMTMPQFARQFAGKLVGSKAAPGSVEEICSVMSEVSIDAYRTAMHTITLFDQRANLPNINVPTLLIAGEEDRNSPAPMMAKMATKIAASECVILPATGHMAPIENPQYFNQHLFDFLKQVSPQ